MAFSYEFVFVFIRSFIGVILSKNVITGRFEKIYKRGIDLGQGLPVEEGGWTSVICASAIFISINFHLFLHFTLSWIFCPISTLCFGMLYHFRIIKLWWQGRVFLKFTTCFRKKLFWNTELCLNPLMHNVPKWSDTL